MVWKGQTQPEVTYLASSKSGSLWFPPKAESELVSGFTDFHQVTEATQTDISFPPRALAKMNWKLMTPCMWWTVQWKPCPPSFLTTYIQHGQPWQSRGGLSWRQRKKGQMEVQGLSELRCPWPTVYKFRPEPTYQTSIGQRPDEIDLNRILIQYPKQ